MTDTPTQRNRLRQQGFATNRGVWGAPNLNEVLQGIDDSLDGQVTITVVNGDNTLTTTDYAASQSRNRMIRLEGALTASATIIIPNVEKWYFVHDTTTRDVDNHTITFRNQSAATGVELRNGDVNIAICDGLETILAGGGTTIDSLGAPANNVDMATFRIVNMGVPRDGNDAATMGYVDTVVANSSILPLTADWGNVARGVQVQVRRDTADALDAFTPVVAEVMVDTTNNTLRVGDGTTVGGTALATDAEVTAVSAGLATVMDDVIVLTVGL